MAVTQQQRTEAAARAPAPRGGSVPLSVAVLATGAASIALVILGPFLVVAAHGFVPYRRIVAGILSPTTAILVLTGMGLGALAIAAGFAVYRRMPTKKSREQSVSGAVLGIQAVVLGAMFLWFRAGDPERFTFHFLNIEKLEGYGRAFLNGAKNTVFLAFIGETGGIALGLILAMLVMSHRVVTRAPARTYINFFRGTPLIWQLTVFYFGFSIGLGFRLSAYQVAMIVFALNTAAYAAEVFRAGIQSIERGQMEAARSLGMSYMQAMRYSIVPQAVRRVIPPLMNEFVILIKDTSLITVLGLLATELDLFSVAREGYSTTYNATFFWAAAAGYLAVTLPLIGIVNMVERRMRSGLVSVTGAG